MHQVRSTTVRLTLTAWLLTAALLGCTGLENKSRTYKLDAAINEYANALRWQRIETAAVFARPRDPDVGSDYTRPEEWPQVTNFTANVENVSEEWDEALVSLRFQFIAPGRASVETFRQRAVWYYDTDKGGWLMDDTLPDFSSARP